MPVDPGVPIGCLLSPQCGPKLFTHPNGRTVAPQAPVDPGKGLPCLINATQCGNLLSVGRRDALFQRAMSPDDVVTQGAKIGDYIPLQPQPAPAPQSVGPDRQQISDQCTTSIVSAKDAARTAQRSSGESVPRRAALENVVSTYKTALTNCQPLQR